MSVNKNLLRVALTCAVMAGTIGLAPQGVAVDNFVSSSTGIANSSNYPSNGTLYVVNREGWRNYTYSPAEITLGSLTSLPTIAGATNLVINGIYPNYTTTSSSINGNDSATGWTFGNGKTGVASVAAMKNLNLSNFGHTEYGLIYANVQSSVSVDNLTIDGVKSSNNDSAAVWGGVLSAVDGSTLSISNSTIKNTDINSSYIGETHSGGVILIQGNNPNNTSGKASTLTTISNTTFETNSLTSNVKDAYGGVLFNEGITTEIKDSTFNKNSVNTTGSYNAFGGAISNGGSWDNRGDASIGTISGTEFTENTATAVSGNAYGGAIWNKSGATISSITASTFSGNQATSTSGSGYGGAIYNDGTISKITDTNFTKNSATTAGGAIYNAGTMTLESTSGKTMTFSGNTVGTNGSGSDIYQADGAQTTLTGAGDFVFGGSIAGKGTITKDSNSSGTVTLNGDNSKFTGTYNQNAGTTTVGTSGQMFGGTSNILAGTLNYYAKNDLVDTASIIVNSAALIVGDGTNEANLTIQNNSSINSAISTLIKYNGTLTNAKESTLAGTVEVQTGGNLANTSTLTLNNTLTNSGTVTNSSTMTASGAVTNSGTITNNENSTFTAASTISNSGKIENYGEFNASGVLNNNQYGTITNSGTMTANGAVTNDGTIENSGTLKTTSGFTNNGTLTNNTAATAEITTLTNNATVANSGTLTVSGALTNNTSAQITNSGTMTANKEVTNSGTIENSGTLKTTADFTNNGTLTNNTAATAEIATLTNNATVTNAGSLTVSGALTNNQSGTITNSGTMTAKGAVTNDGTIENSGTLKTTADFTNNGTLTNNTGATAELATLANNATVTNGGSLTVSGALINNQSGTITNSGTMTANGAVTNDGKIANNTGSKLTLNSTTTSNAGTLENNGTLDINGAVTGTGTISNSGTVTLDANASAFTGTYTQTGGTTTVNTSAHMFGGKKDIQSGSMTVSEGSFDYTNVNLGNNAVLNQTVTSPAETTLSSTVAAFTGSGASINVSGGSVSLDKIDNGNSNSINLTGSTVTPAVKDYTGGTNYTLNGSTLNLMDGENNGYSFSNLNATDSSKLSLDVGLGENAVSDTLTVANGSGTFNISSIRITEDNGLFDSSKTNSKTVQVINNGNGSTLQIGTSDDTGIVAEWSTNVYEYEITADTTNTKNDSLKFTGVDGADPNSLKKMNNYTKTPTRGFSVVGSSTYHIAEDLGTTEAGTFTVNGQGQAKSIISGQRVKYTGTLAGGDIKYETDENGNYVLSDDKGSFFELTDTEKPTVFTLDGVTIQDAARVQGQTYEGGSVLYADSSKAKFTVEGVLITSNKSYGNGGAFDIENASSGSTINKSRFTNNKSNNGLGGAIYTNTAINIYASGFNGNTDKNGSNDIYIDGNGSVTFTTGVDGDGTVSSIRSGLAGSGAFTKNGTGTLELEGVNNRYTGNFSIAEGIVDYTQSTGGSFVGGNVAMGSGTILNIINENADNAKNFSSTDSTAAINKSGAGVLNVTGNNSEYKGAINIKAGELAYKADDANARFFANENNITISDGAKLSVNTNEQSNQTGGNLASETTGGEFNKNGKGTFTLTGKNSGFTGNTNIKEGTLAFNKTADTSFVTGKTTVGSGAELDYNVADNLTDTLSQLNGSGKLTKDGNGVLTVQNHKFSDGNAKVAGGTLKVISSDKAATDIDFKTVIDGRAKLDYTAAAGTTLTLGGTDNDGNARNLSFASGASGAEAIFNGASASSGTSTIDTINLDTITNAANNSITLNNIGKVVLNKTSYEGTYNLNNSKLDLMDGNSTTGGIKEYTFDKLTTSNGSKLSIDVDLAADSLGADKIVVNNNDSTQYLLDLTDFSILKDDGIFTTEDNTKTVQVIKNNNSSNVSLVDGSSTQVSPTLAAWSSSVYQYEINAKQYAGSGAYDSLVFKGIGATNPDTLKTMNNYQKVQTRGFSVIEGSSPYHISKDLEQTKYGNFTVTGVSKTDSIISGERVSYTIDAETGKVIISEYTGDDKNGSFFELTDDKGSTTLNLHDFTIQDAARTTQDIKNGSVIYSAISDAVITVNNVNFKSNTAAAGNGGAVYLEKADTANFTDSDFNSNNAVNGGALYNAVAKTVLSNATFNGNTATEKGGAIYAAANMTVINSTFGTTTANTANGVGNDIYIATPATLTFETTASSNTGTITSGIAGDGTFQKTGEGTLSLNGRNQDFTGTFAVTDGTVNYTADDANDSFVGGEVQIAGGSELVMSISSDTVATQSIQNVSGYTKDNITTSGTLTKTGAGVLNLNGNNSDFTGTADVEEGQLKFNFVNDTDNYFGTSSTTDLAEGTKLNFNIADGKTYTLTSTQDMLKGSGQIEKSGGGKLILNGDYSGLNTAQTDGTYGIVTGTVISDGILEYVAKANTTNKMVTGGVSIANDTEFIVTNNDSTNAFSLFEDGQNAGAYNGGLIGSTASKFTTNGNVNLYGNNYNFSGQTTVNSGTLAFTKTDPASFVQGDVNLAKTDSKVLYTTTNAGVAQGDSEKVTSISGKGTFEKEGSGTLNINKTDDFTGTINANAGTLNVTAPTTREETATGFNFSTNITNAAIYNYIANEGDNYTLDNDAKVVFTNASGATASFTNGTYDLASDLSGAMGNTTKFTNAMVNTATKAEGATGTSYSGNYALDNSTLNLADDSVQNVTFSQLSASDTNLRLDFDFANNGQFDTLISTTDKGGKLTLTDDSFNVLNTTSDNGTTTKEYTVLSGLTWANDAATYTGSISSDIYKYTVGIKDGTKLTLTASDYADNLTLYKLNHEKYGDRTFQLVGDSTNYYIGQSLDTTNAGDATEGSTTAGSLTITGRTDDRADDRADTIIARANADSTDKLSMFVMNNTNAKTTLTIKNVTIKDAAATQGSVINATSTLATAILNNTTITNNTSSTAGGAIYNNGKLTVENSAFSNNSVTGTTSGDTAYGGAIYNSGTIDKLDATFSENSISSSVAESAGGAVFNYGAENNYEQSHGTIESITGSFSENTVSSSQNVYGGAILNHGVIGTISAAFTNNTIRTSDVDRYSSNGGAIANNGTITSIAGTTDNKVSFSNNTATSGQGGAIFNRANQFGKGKIESITNAEFSGNSAARGGAIYNGGTYNSVTSEISLITNTAFNNNTATDGSAIYNAGNMTLQDVTFSGNTGNSYIFNSGTMTIATDTANIALNNQGTSGNNIVNNGTLYLTQTTDKTFTVADVLKSTLTDSKGIVNTNAADKISFNNLVDNMTVNVKTGSAEFKNSNTGNVALNQSDLNISSGATATVTDSNITGGTAVVNSGSTLNFVVNSGSNSTTAAISGSGTINKTGAGTEILDGTDGDFKGTANITEGTLQYNKTADNAYFGTGSTTNVTGSTSVLDYIDKVDSEYTFDRSFSTIYLNEGGTLQITGNGASSTFTLDSGLANSDTNKNNLIFNSANYVINANNITTAKESNKDLITINNSTITMGSGLSGTDLSGKDSGAKSYDLSSANYAMNGSTLDLVNRTAGDNYVFDELKMATSTDGTTTAKLGIDVNLNLKNGSTPFADTITATKGSTDANKVTITKIFVTADDGGLKTWTDDDGNEHKNSKGIIQVFKDSAQQLKVADTNDAKILSWATNVYTYDVKSAQKDYEADSIEVIADGISSTDTLRDMNVDLGKTENRGFSFILDDREGVSADKKNSYNIYRNLDTTAAGNFTVIGLNDENVGKSVLSGKLEDLVVEADNATTDPTANPNARLIITTDAETGAKTYKYWSDNDSNGDPVYTDVTNYIKENTTTTEGVTTVTGYTVSTKAFSGDKTNGSMFELVNNTAFEMSNVSVENAKRYSDDTIKDGSVIYANNEDKQATIQLTNVDFKNNSVEVGNGGAIANVLSKSFSLTNSTITGNSASGNGGAIYNTSNTSDTSTGMTLANITADNNTSGGKGGAIYTSADMQITDSSFGVNKLNYHKWNGTEVGSVDVQNDIYIEGSGTDLAFVTSEGKTSTINSGIAGDGNFTKSGSGTLNLNGRNQDFTGTFAVTGGTVNYTKDSDTDSFVKGSVQVGSGSILSMTIGENLSEELSGVSGYTKDGTTTSGNIDKNGDGTLNLGGNNSGFDGQLNINGGSLVYNADEDIDSYFKGGTYINSGANLTLNIGENVKNQTISKIYNKDGVQKGGTITKTGAGEITLSGDNSSFTGETDINEGTLTYKVTDASDKYFGGNTVIDTNGTLKVVVPVTDGNGKNVSEQKIGNLSNGTNGGGKFIVANTQSGSNYGTIELVGANSDFTGTTEIQSGILAYVADGTNGKSYVGGSTVIDSTGILEYTVNENIIDEQLSKISGSGELNKRGSGTLNLTGANSEFTGAVDIDGGTIAYTTADGSAFINAKSYDIASGASLDIANSGDDTVNVNNVSGKGDITKSSDGTMKLTGDNSEFAGDLKISDGIVAYTKVAGTEGTTGTSYISGNTIFKNQNAELQYNVAKDDTDTLSKVSSATSGYGVLNKQGDGTLTFNAVDNSGFTGTANINAGTLNTTGAKTDGFDFNVRVTDGKLNYTAADGANITFKSDNPPSVEFTTEKQNATMQFNGGTYNLVGVEIVNATGNNIIFGKDSDDSRTTTVVMSASATHENGNFTIQNAIIDLTQDSGATSERVISNLTTTNTGLKIDVNLTLPNATYDSLNVSTTGSGSVPVSLTTFNISDNKTDNGLKSTYTLNVLKGLTFNADTSIKNWATTTYEYQVGFNGGDVILTAYKAADNNSLYVMNHETSDERGFNFTKNDDKPYEIGKDLDETLAGNFVVNGVKDGDTVISGSDKYSMFEVVNDTDLQINDLTLTKAAGDEGSALVANNGSANIDLNNVSITDSSSTGDGGAVSNKNSEKFEVSGGTLSGNTSGGNGGAISNTSSGTTKIDSVTASGNTAANHGGVIYNTASGTTTLDKFTADGNTATNGRGGAIYTAADMTITDSNFGTTTLNKDSKGQNDIYIAGSGTNVNFVTNSDSTINSGIAGDGKLNKSGDATLNLSGKNDEFTGNLNITSGDVVFKQNSADDTYIKGTTNIGKGTSLTVNNSLSEAIIGEIAGTGDFTKEGSQNVVLSGDNSDFKGNANINEGNLVWNADSTKYIGGKTNLGDNGGLTVNTNNGADLTNINGTGTISKTGSGKLVMTGDNSGFKGNLDVQGGSFGVDTGSVIGSINNATFAGGTSINLQNTKAVQDTSGNWTTSPNPASIENLYFNNLTLNGNVGLDIDIDLANKTADKVGAGSVSGGGHLVLGKDSLNVVSDSLLANTNVQIAYGALANGDNIILDEAAKVVMGPIQKYDVTYSGGSLGFTRQGGTNPDINTVNPSVMASVVATQVGGYLTQVETLHAGFFHMDRYTKYTRNARLAAENPNTYADSEPTVPAYSNGPIPETSQAMWVKPYTSFEKVNLKGGIGVSNVMYGALYGGDTDLVDLGHGFKGVISAFVGYNGSHQAYNGISMNQQGGTLGLTGTLYKGNFFTGLTVSTGASAGEAYTSYGTDHFSMITAGIANKTGYNLELKEGKVIIQPSLFLGYTFVNTFDYTNSAGVRVDSDPLHAIQVIPGVRIIGNLKHGWQPYAGVDMVWNIMDKTDVMANDVRLPQLSVKPYVQYGVGVQKSWSERFTAFFQTMIRNGGRNGIVLTGGFRWLFGKGGSSNKKSANAPAQRKVIKELKK